MVRPFAPTKLGLTRDCIPDLIEMRLSHSGEYIYHIPIGGSKQAVVVNYQFIPVDANINPDFILTGTNHKFYGLLEHFIDKPETFREGNAAKADRGSQFEIRGRLFNAKRINVNHRGMLFVELVQDDKCAETRADFCTEIAALTC